MSTPKKYATKQNKQHSCIILTPTKHSNERTATHNTTRKKSPTAAVRETKEMNENNFFF